MVEDIRAKFSEYDGKTLEKVQQIFIKRYNQVLKSWRGNVFEVEHTGTAQR